MFEPVVPQFLLLPLFSVLPTSWSPLEILLLLYFPGCAHRCPVYKTTHPTTPLTLLNPHAGRSHVSSLLRHLASRHCHCHFHLFALAQVKRETWNKRVLLTWHRVKMTQCALALWKEGEVVQLVHEDRERHVRERDLAAWLTDGLNVAFWAPGLTLRGVLLSLMSQSNGVLDPVETLRILVDNWALVIEE